MKILYSQIEELIPDLKATPTEVANVLTLIGFMRDDFKEVRYRNRKDYLLSFEIRQNRADCLSVLGLAKEVCAYYGFKIRLPSILPLPTPESKKRLDIKVNAVDYVKRTLAVEIIELKNTESPKWLKEFLSLYEMNCVNLLVDLSNYVMLFAGNPSHLLDKNKIEGQVSWTLNNNLNKITTLDGFDIELKKGELVVRDEKNILALAGIIGGKVAKIDIDTKSIIAEMAIYDSSIVRRNSRNLKIITEASQRLSKELDPNGLEFAMGLLTSMIIENCGGSIGSKVFDYYPQKYISPDIEFDPRTPSLYAGIDVPKEKSIRILKNLNFKIRNMGDKLMVTPPINRTDVSIQEDLIEEVIRIFGYNKIPSNELPKLKTVNNITPKNIYLAEKIRDILFALGFDEIFSLPLTKKEDNSMVNYLDWDVISTQNSVNEDYPELRQSIIVGLINQLKEFLKKNIEIVKIFEIGKTFGKREDKYEEYEALGILLHMFSQGKKLSEAKAIIEKLLRSIGFTDISYIESKSKPKIANPYSCWNVTIKKESVGIFYKLKPLKLNQHTYSAELNLNKITKLLEKTHTEPIVELTQKLIVLDANVELKENESITNFLEEIKKKIKYENIWSIAIVDRFQLKEKIKYTIRVFYKELSDQEAKKTHLKVFNL